jgi:hypothetical protein
MPSLLKTLGKSALLEHEVNATIKINRSIDEINLFIEYVLPDRYKFAITEH